MITHDLSLFVKWGRQLLPSLMYSEAIVWTNCQSVQANFYCIYSLRLISEVNLYKNLYLGRREYVKKKLPV